MADTRDPRPSTDEGSCEVSSYSCRATSSHVESERAPLLQDSQAGPSQQPKPSIAQRLSHVVQEPLTTLAKILLVLVLVLLLLSSVFIGLFAGAQHKLNHPKGGDGDGGKIPVTATRTETTTVFRTDTLSRTATRTDTFTTTETSVTSRTTTTTAVSETTAIETTTTTKTKTVIIPAPVPTDKPGEVGNAFPCYSVPFTYAAIVS